MSSWDECAYAYLGECDGDISVYGGVGQIVLCEKHAEVLAKEGRLPMS